MNKQEKLPDELTNPHQNLVLFAGGRAGNKTYTMIKVLEYKLDRALARIKELDEELENRKDDAKHNLKTYYQMGNEIQSLRQQLSQTLAAKEAAEQAVADANKVISELSLALVLSSRREAKLEATSRELFIELDTKNLLRWKSLNGTKDENRHNGLSISDVEWVDIRERYYPKPVEEK